MHTGYIMVPQNIKSPSTALVVFEGKLLPAVTENTCTSLVLTKK